MDHVHGESSRVPLLAPLLVALVSAAGCNREAARDPSEKDFISQGAQVVAVDVGRGIGHDLRVTARPGVDEYRPGDTIYASVSTAGSAAHATLTARWTYQDSVLVDTTSAEFNPTGPGLAEFHISHPNGLLPGRYRVEILLNGRRAQSREFSVKKP